MLKYLLCSIWLSMVLVECYRDHKLVHEWITLDFRFPSEEIREEAIESGEYVPENAIPISISVQYREGRPPRKFMASLRSNLGVPATMGVIGDDGIIDAYPGSKWQENPGYNCDGITSVYRTFIDECNRLWVGDGGRLVQGQWLCTPQVLAFDLDTDELVFRYKISNDTYRGSFIGNVVADIGDTCDDAFIYLADGGSFAIIVVDVKAKTDWRVSHRLFLPHPDRAIIRVEDIRIELGDGIVSMALSPKENGFKDRRLYFHSLPSTTENYVLTETLKNWNQLTYDERIDSMVQLPNERDSQSVAENIDSNGVMFFGLMDPPRLACWNIYTEHEPSNIHILDVNPDDLHFLTGMRVVKNLDGEEELWTMASSYERFRTGKLHKDKPNIKMNYSKIKDLIKGTPCATPMPPK